MSQQVQIEYEDGCKNYTIGFASAMYLASASLLLPAGFARYFLMTPLEPLISPAAALGGAFYLLASLIMIVAYTHPVTFYELFESEPDTGGETA